MARRLGASEELLEAVQRDGPVAPGAVEPAWAAALAYADAVTVSGHSVTEELWHDLAAHWDPGEIVEITMVVGLFSYFNRFNDALRVEVTR